MSFKTGSSAHAIDIDVQRRYWDRWNAEHREKNQVFTSRRQADIVVGWLRRLGRSDLEMLDVGCGSGWLADRLIEFGAVTGTDLAPDVLERAKSRLPNATFVSGDFMELEFEEEGFDVVVGLEALSHMIDQPAFVRKLRRLVRKGGRVMIATQNRPVFETLDWARDDGAPRYRRWVTESELRALFADGFEIEELFSAVPVRRGGLSRILNASKVYRALVALLGDNADKIRRPLGLGDGMILMLKAKRIS